MKTELENILSAIVAAEHEAAALIMHAHGIMAEIKTGHRDVVTEYDRRVQTLTPCVAVALCRALERACGVTPEIKWPNDLLINGKKLCGILVESSTVRGRLYVVIGMGLNINTAPADFPEELRDTAGSLFGELGRRFELEDVAAAIIEELDAMYAAWQTDPACCLADYRRLCVSINRPVTLIRNGVSRAAFARDIDESYALVADVDGAEEHISTGEISLRNA